MNFVKTIVAAGLVAASTSAFAADITGAGSTFIYPVLSKWADAYKKETGNGVNYQSIGSGAGIKQIEAKTVTFGATDMPLKVDQLEKDGLAQWPMIMGAIVPVVNIEGVKAGDMVLDGETLANIYLGKITKWDDPAIKKLNPKLTLPSDAIAVVHRADGSGTTFNFTDYLSKVSADWKSQGRLRHRGRMAGRRRRQGQRRRFRQYRPDQELDRLCRIRLRQAEQADLHRAGQQGRQDRGADQRSLPGGRFQRRLGACSGLLPDPHRPAGRQVLADRRLDLHPDAQGSRPTRRPPPKPSSSSNGPSPRAARWPKTSTTSRCRTRWSS